MFQNDKNTVYIVFTHFEPNKLVNHQMKYETAHNSGQLGKNSLYFKLPMTYDIGFQKRKSILSSFFSSKKADRNHVILT